MVNQSKISQEVSKKKPGALQNILAQQVYGPIIL